MTFQFQEKALQDAEKNYKKVELDAQKRQIVNNVAKIISKYLDINELALRGFVLFSVKETQQDFHLELKNMASMTPIERKRFIQTVFKKIGQKLEKIFLPSSDADYTKLHEALEKALEYRMSQNV